MGTESAQATEPLAAIVGATESMDTAMNRIEHFDHEVLAGPLPHAGTRVFSALNSGEGSRLPSGGEESAADWFCGHLDELKNFLEGRDATPGHEVPDPRRGVPPAAAFPTEVTEALHHGDFAQVWNDFKHVMAADALQGTTETIQFGCSRFGYNLYLIDLTLPFPKNHCFS